MLPESLFFCDWQDVKRSGRPNGHEVVGAAKDVSFQRPPQIVGLMKQLFFTETDDDAEG